MLLKFLEGDEIEINFDFKNYSKNYSKNHEDTIVFPFVISQYLLSVLKRILERTNTEYPPKYTQQEKNALRSSLYKPIWDYLEMNEEFYDSISEEYTKPLYVVSVADYDNGFHKGDNPEPKREYKEYVFESNKMAIQFVKELLYYYQNIFGYNLHIQDDLKQFQINSSDILEYEIDLNSGDINLIRKSHILNVSLKRKNIIQSLPLDRLRQEQLSYKIVSV